MSIHGRDIFGPMSEKEMNDAARSLERHIQIYGDKHGDVSALHSLMIDRTYYGGPVIFNKRFEEIRKRTIRKGREFVDLDVFIENATIYMFDLREDEKRHGMRVVENIICRLDEIIDCVCKTYHIKQLLSALQYRMMGLQYTLSADEWGSGYIALLKLIENVPFIVFMILYRSPYEHLIDRFKEDIK